MGRTTRSVKETLPRLCRHGGWAAGTLLLASTLLTTCGKGADSEATEPSTRSQPFNVLLISIDTLRADHLSLYGYKRPTSPQLDAMAAEAVVFDQFIMNGGFTLPSHMTMMTGLLPTVHGIRAHTDMALPESRITLAEQLQEEGYATAAFVDGGYLRGHYGFTQGFDLYDDEGGRFETLLPKARAWLKTGRAAGRPFFLFLHTYDVHAHPDRPPFPDRRPYNCPNPFPHRYVAKPPATFDGCRDGECASKVLHQVNRWANEGKAVPAEYFSREEMEFIVALYDGCINYVDQRIGELMDFLRHLNLYNRTLIVVTSDHGEEFLEHGMLLHHQRGYEEFAHIPLIMKLPRSHLGGRRVPHLAAMIDLLPTVLDVVGLPANRQAQGRSLLPMVTKDQPLREDTSIWEVLRTERWKYFPRQKRLFDLSADPAERHNLYDRSPKVVAHFEERSRRRQSRDRRYAEALDNLTDGVNRKVVLTEKQLDELRALGYIQ